MARYNSSFRKSGIENGMIDALASIISDNEKLNFSAK
tara:strand:- start:440 stop:550 length:111 start_codon:yes stop_codon:yes gene_type:complete